MWAPAERELDLVFAFLFSNRRARSWVYGRKLLCSNVIEFAFNWARSRSFDIRNGTAETRLRALNWASTVWPLSVSQPVWLQLAWAASILDRLPPRARFSPSRDSRRMRRNRIVLVRNRFLCNIIVLRRRKNSEVRTFMNVAPLAGVGETFLRFCFSRSHSSQTNSSSSAAVCFSCSHSLIKFTRWLFSLSEQARAHWFTHNPNRSWNFPQNYRFFVLCAVAFHVLALLFISYRVSFSIFLPPRSKGESSASISSRRKEKKIFSLFFPWVRDKDEAYPYGIFHDAKVSSRNFWKIYLHERCVTQQGHDECWHQECGCHPAQIYSTKTNPKDQFEIRSKIPLRKMWLFTGFSHTFARFSHSNLYRFVPQRVTKIH